MVAQLALEVWRLVPGRARMALVAAANLMAVAAWINAQIPVWLGDLANSIGDSRQRGQLWSLSDAQSFIVTLSVLFLLREVLNVIRKFLVHNTTTDIEKQVTVDLVSTLLHADLLSLSGQRIGALNGRIRRGAEGFVKLLKLCFMDFLPAVLIAALAIGVALQRNLLLGAVMAAVVPIATYIVFRQISSQKGVRIDLLKSKENVDAAMVEQLTGIECVRAANTHDREVERVSEVCEAVRSRELRHHFQMSLFDFGKAINESVFFILVIALSIGMVANGAMPVGEIITFSMLFASILAPLREIHRIVDEAHESALKARDLFQLGSEPRDRSFAVIDPIDPILDGTVPAIEFRDVCLKFRSADGTFRKGLSRVSVSIPTNHVVGVAGYSGSGKSTWLRALLRLAHPSSGTILIGGVPIERISREVLARVVGYVGQSPFLFAGTIRDNIAYGSNSASLAQIVDAAAAAGILDEILSLPGAFDAPVFEGGRNLSGGQRQRIAIARVFLHEPVILVLDEATSALDNATERRVQAALNDFCANRTIIMVAHRLSTLRDAQSIYVFDQGSIAQAGSFEKLAASPGIFSELLASAEQHSRPRARSTGGDSALAMDVEELNG